MILELFTIWDNCYYENVFDALPASWSLCSLGSITNIARGASPRPIKQHITSSQNGIPWIKIGDTKPGDIYIENTKERIKPESVNKSVFLKKGSLILSNSMSFGRPYILKIDGCIHDGWLSISIYNNTVDVEFLQYILQGYMWYFKNTASGSGVDNLNIDKVREMPFALPPLNEQRRILNKLRKIDTLINVIRDNQIEINDLVRRTKQEVLDNIFNEKSSYKSYYPSSLIVDICNLDNGTKSNSGLLPYLEAKVLRKAKEPTIVDNGVFISKGTRIILVDGENSGEIMTAHCDGYMGSTFKILNVKSEKVDENYLSLFIAYYKQLLRENKTGAAIPHLNKKLFYSLTIPVPPLDEQQDIYTKISKLFKILDIVNS